MTRTFAMNKLVRDAIPDQMKDQGQKVIMRELTGVELQKSLLVKLKEEIDEALAELDDKKALMGELADAQEVLDQIYTTCDIDRDELQKSQTEKRQARGGFKKGYYIETVEVDDDGEWTEYFVTRPLQYHEVLKSDEDFSPPHIEPGVYQHYKGNYYEVLGVGYYTESHEYAVVYRSLYEKTHNPKIWIRPFDMFVETIEKGGQVIPRFKKV